MFSVSWGTNQLRDAAIGRNIGSQHDICAEEDSICCAALFGGGERVALGCWSGRIRFWDLISREEIRVLEIHSGGGFGKEKRRNNCPFSGSS